MAEEAIRTTSDPRLKLMSHTIRHGQRGEIALMHGSRGFRQYPRHREPSVARPLSELRVLRRPTQRCEAEQLTFNTHV